jgi:hypothetical protein
MRTIAALLLVIVILFAGMAAASTQADRVNDGGLNNSSQDAYDTVTAASSTLTQSTGLAVVVGGLSGVFMVSFGILIAMAKGGR